MLQGNENKVIGKIATITAQKSKQ